MCAIACRTAFDRAHVGRRLCGAHGHARQHELRGGLYLCRVRQLWSVDDEREAVRADPRRGLDGEHGGVERERQAERLGAVGQRLVRYDAGGRSGPSGASSSSMTLRAAVT